MKAIEILKCLDREAEDYQFPVLDNHNFDLAQARVSVFRNCYDWLLVFEVLGVDGKLDISTDLYAYGNALKEQGLVIGLDDRVSSPDPEEWINDDGEFILNPYKLDLVINDKHVKEELTKEDYLAANIEENEFNPTKLVRYLSSQYKRDLWLSPADLEDEIDIKPDMELFFQTDEWQHIDEEKPSENPFFQSLAEAIELNNVALVNKGEVNTHWSNWTWNDFDKQ